MKIYELKIKTFLLQDVEKKDVQKELAHLINNFLTEKEEFKKLHESKEFKPYCFDNLMPFEKVYKKNNMYTFRIRTIDEELLQYFLYDFERYRNSYFQNLTMDVKEIKPRLIRKIYSLAPVVMQTPEGYWRNHWTEEEYMKYLEENLHNKSKQFLNKEILNNNLLKEYEFQNEYPISRTMKDITFLGDKIDIEIGMDAESQELAQLAVGCGLGQINSYGNGFVNYKYYGNEKKNA